MYFRQEGLIARLSYKNVYPLNTEMGVRIAALDHKNRLGRFAKPDLLEIVNQYPRSKALIKLQTRCLGMAAFSISRKAMRLVLIKSINWMLGACPHSHFWALHEVYLDCWSAGKDPLVLDLDGDGIETLAVENGVLFNIGGGVFETRTGWVDGDDGLLALDANGNGRIDAIGELFGNRFEGGFAELAGLDSNADRVIDARDAAVNDNRWGAGARAGQWLRVG